MRLCSVIVSYNRLELLKETVFSYLETVSLPFTLMIVDNRSERETRRWLKNSGLSVIFLSQNRYPGYATNRGWEAGIGEATEYLHRSDNDFRYVTGWCDAFLERFQDQGIGQVGLRTDEEERFNGHNVGGNCVIRRSLWEEGLRYDERPWPEIKTFGYTEDSFFSPAVTKLGYRWTRVTRQCVQSLAVEDPHDPYYLKSWEDRGVLAQSRAAYGIVDE